MKIKLSSFKEGISDKELYKGSIEGYTVTVIEKDPYSKEPTTEVVVTGPSGGMEYVAGTYDTLPSTVDQYIAVAKSSSSFKDLMDKYTSLSDYANHYEDIPY